MNKLFVTFSLLDSYSPALGILFFLTAISPKTHCKMKRNKSIFNTLTFLIALK